MYMLFRIKCFYINSLFSDQKYKYFYFNLINIASNKV